MKRIEVRAVNANDFAGQEITPEILETVVNREVEKLADNERVVCFFPIIKGAGSWLQILVEVSDEND